ncbi:MAG: branched-chain amino acid ABC transporter substrate-binding protein [Betaproteobacteria bacterium]
MIAYLLRVLVLASIVVSVAIAAEPIRIALIEPFSGPFANIGTESLHAFQSEFDRINANGGVLDRHFEIIALDNKSSPQEATLQVQFAIDQGIRYILQGAGSNVGHAISDAVAKFNARNPARPVLYLNHAALDPALTTEKCHFWHFRFVPNGDMILAALTDALARDARIKRVYLINQDYVWGQSVARNAKAMLKQKRPDVEIVGEDLHPIGKVKDFAPYVAKMGATHADAIITGNWGNDLALLIRSVKDSGLPLEVYAPLAGLQGAAAAMGASGADRVRAVLFWHSNVENDFLLKNAQDFKAKYGQDWSWLPNYLTPELLSIAMQRAQSIEPTQVALALEGLRMEGPTGPLWMRAEDHQLMLPVFQTVFTRAGGPDVRYDAENTGFGWKTEGKVAADENVPLVTCRVQRPKSQ